MSLHRYLTRLIWACVLPLLLLVFGLSVLYVAHLQQGHLVGMASTQWFEAGAALAAAMFIATLTAVLGGKWAGGRLARSLASLTQPLAPPPSEPDIAEIAALREGLNDARTERDNAYAANSNSQRRFRAIFEQAAVGISIVAPDGHWLLANQKLCDITGYPLNELVTKTFQEITHPDDLQADLDQSGQLLAGDIDNFSLEKRYIRKDGAAQWVRLTAALVRQSDGMPDFFISVVDDIQQHKQTQEALLHSEARYRSLIAELQIGVILQGPAAEIILSNKKALELLGLTADQLLGKTSFDPDWNVTHPDGTPFPGPSHPVPMAIASRKPVHNVVMGVYRTTTQNRIWLQVNATPHLTVNGTVRHVVCTFMDITARRQAEAQLAQHSEHLEQLVATRTAELETAKQAAEDANQVKGEFLATMSHELRTPLNAMMGLSQLLGDSPLSIHQRDYMSKIQSSSQALRALIDDILDFSMIDAGQLQLDSEPFSLDAILRTTASVLGLGNGEKPIEILFKVAPDVPDALMGDAPRVQQIILNLTSNAVKFTDAGSIVVSVRCQSQSDTQVTLIFSVRDTGIGIPPAQLGSIFEGFNRGRRATDRLYGGAGLGLSISAQLAQLMGGHITVDSTVALGSEFRLQVIFPLVPSTCTLPASDILPALRLLIIDDHPMAREVLAQTCTDLGWLTTAVDSGAAGLQELRHSASEGRDYDVMLLDWRMPGMDGLGMLHQAYSAPDVGLAPVVLMVGAFELQQALAASGDLHIEVIVSKPTTPSSLQEALTRAYAGETTTPPTQSKPADRRLAGMRLLVAEDNALNRDVILDILTRSGAEVVMVEHGLEAVDALRTMEAPFDAVLMDIQMPVMDGYAATRVIREDLGLVDLPIIAVTAFARLQDREKSRAAGMVGHVVKPLNVEDLLDLVARERRGAPQPRVLSRVDAESPPGLNLGAAMDAFGGDTTRYKELLRKFMAQHGHDIEEARACVDAGDIQSARNVLHSLSGIAKLLQASPLGRLASEAENALTDGDTAALPPLWDALQAAMQTLSQSIGQFTAA